MTILNRTVLASRISDTLSDLDQDDVTRGERLSGAFASWFVTIVNPPITNRSISIYKNPVMPILSRKIESQEQFENMIQSSLDLMAKITLLDPSVISAISTGITVILPNKRISLDSAIETGLENIGNVVDDVSMEIASQAVSWAKSGSVAPAGSPTGISWS